MHTWNYHNASHSLYDSFVFVIIIKFKGIIMSGVSKMGD
jgi:hypothetical protein